MHVCETRTWVWGNEAGWRALENGATSKKSGPSWNWTQDFVLFLPTKLLEPNLIPRSPSQVFLQPFAKKATRGGLGTRLTGAPSNRTCIGSEIGQTLQWQCSPQSCSWAPPCVPQENLGMRLSPLVFYSIPLTSMACRSLGLMVSEDSPFTSTIRSPTCRKPTATKKFFCLHPVHVTHNTKFAKFH